MSAKSKLGWFPCALASYSTPRVVVQACVGTSCTINQAWGATTCPTAPCTSPRHPYAPQVWCMCHAPWVHGHHRWVGAPHGVHFSPWHLPPPPQGIYPPQLGLKPKMHPWHHQILIKMWCKVLCGVVQVVHGTPVPFRLHS